MQAKPIVLISDIRALWWWPGLSARVLECQKLKTIGLAWMAKCNDLKNWALKGLILEQSLLQ